MSQLYFPSLSPENVTADGPASTAELQGALCGLLCMDAQANRNTWYSDLFEDYQPGEEEKQNLLGLFDETIQSLNSLDFDFQLELPDDDAPIGSRLAALSDWCQGLVFGLGVSGLTNETELAADCQEYLTDVLQISQIDDIELQTSDDDDNNYEELVEYLRMGLFLLYGELHPVAPEDIKIEH
ncbi:MULTISPECIES: UPF0149 family protein [unclassified Methylophaga]|uniref:UPF0149 family protein n=1 Tax=unclassified Methylophaga TaxID=2629249 RepID=UPI000C96CEBE|nr:MULTISPECIES: UPF0149 family protein [unclassified Methylophaga]MAK66474.1 hypothetical protein [Methylophaga sp.]MAY17167.1 hypothetical protein [Methylophaga sp.]MBN46039.1 hypothetical protein [Methylophaga sp.]|tara:strand:- start:5957 stop:6505 length:549 start_codon:yes stop_codon:yes gene_type:complete